MGKTKKLQKRRNKKGQFVRTTGKKKKRPEPKKKSEWFCEQKTRKKLQEVIGPKRLPFKKTLKN